ncbi:MAG: tetratricopeptide repeat protein [Deltaproteobacteria bacterium]|nr:tetratricopeptide repeat protein [Deltaproteobacteria bacterium]
MATRSIPLLLTAALALAATSAFAGAEQDAGQNNKAVQAYNDGDFESAAFLFADLADNAQSEEIRLKAEFYLAQSLFKRGLYFPALNQYMYVTKAGPNHPHYLKAVEGIVSVSEVLHEDYITGSYLDKEYNEEFAKLPTESLNKINFIVGIQSFRKNKFDDAMSFLTSVPLDSTYFTRSRYLQAVIYGRNQKSEMAIEAFNDVLKLKSTPKLQYADLVSIQELARLGLARTYFGMGRYSDAVATYDEVPRFSEYWDEALFENGWARFQNDDWGGALGSLQALHAPQFAGSFQPESWIVKATVYYYTCLYDDAKGALDAFEKIYLPINEKLKPVVETDKGNDFYYALMAPENQTLPRSVKNYLRANRRLVQFKAFGDELLREKETIEKAQVWKGSKLQADMLGFIEQGRALAVQLTGATVKRRLTEASQNIIGFDSQKEILKFEVAKAETAGLEVRFDARAHMDQQSIWRPKMPATNWEYWQFQGEFWLDEIGYYQYTLKSGCMKKDE